MTTRMPIGSSTNDQSCAYQIHASRSIVIIFRTWALVADRNYFQRPWRRDANLFVFPHRTVGRIPLHARSTRRITYRTFALYFPVKCVRIIVLCCARETRKYNHVLSSGGRDEHWVLKRPWINPIRRQLNCLAGTYTCILEGHTLCTRVPSVRVQSKRKNQRASCVDIAVSSICVACLWSCLLRVEIDRPFSGLTR